MHEEDEDLLGAELKALPPPRAPRTLLPRVMAAVAVSTRPWYARAWVTWPRGLQVASAAVFVLAVAGAWMWGPAAVASVSVPGWIGEIATLARVLRDVLFAPIAIYFAALAIAAALAGSALWAAVNRLALGGASLR